MNIIKSNKKRIHTPIKQSNHAQMMILETIFFAATVILALLFLSQLTPPTVVSNTYTYDLQTEAHSALYTLYYESSPLNRPQGYPSSKLVHYLIINAYGDMIKDLNNLLPSTVQYNIYISDGTRTVCWVNSIGGYTPLPSIHPVTVSNVIVAMNATGFSISANRTGLYDFIPDDNRRFGPKSKEQSDILSLLPDYTGFLYDVKLEIWNI